MSLFADAAGINSMLRQLIIEHEAFRCLDVLYRNKVEAALPYANLLG